MISLCEIMLDILKIKIREICAKMIDKYHNLVKSCKGSVFEITGIINSLDGSISA